eukprot:gene3549-6284_t
MKSELTARGVSVELEISENRPRGGFEVYDSNGNLLFSKLKEMNFPSVSDYDKIADYLNNRY